MAYVSYHPNKKGLFTIFHKDYFIESDIPELERFSINILSNKEVLEVSVDEKIVAHVSAFDIQMSDLLIKQKQLGFFRWGWLIQKENEKQLLTFDSENNLCFEKRIVTKFSGNYNSNILDLLWSRIKRKEIRKDILKLEFDESVIAPQFAFCLLFKELCRRCFS